MTAEDFFSLVTARRGHFLYESGYHSDLWLDLETLCRQPLVVQRYAAELAAKITTMRPEVICGPLIEGAIVAFAVAFDLGCEFAYTMRLADPSRSGMFPVRYELPQVLCPIVCGKRVVIVNDVISAGSAVRGTADSLNAAGATVAGVAALAVLGNKFAAYASERHLALEALLQLPENNLWEPGNCPLCASSVAFEQRASH